MRIWKVMTVTQYLGSGVDVCGYKEIDPDKLGSRQIGKNCYDKIGNQEANFIYLDDIKQVDRVFIRLYRKIKDRYGRKNLPEHAFRCYKESYDRAIEDYPEVLL